MNRFLLSCLLAAAPLLAADSATHISISGREVAIWKPAGAAPALGYPVVVFSHGFGGCNTQSVFLMEALASAGYLVVAPNPAAAGCGRAHRAGSGGWRPEEPFQKAQAW